MTQPSSVNFHPHFVICSSVIPATVFTLGTQKASIPSFASKIKGNTSENLIELLERRLDATVYRMKFATTIFAARQFVSHGHILVNGKKVTIASYSLKNGDLVEVKEKSREIPIVLEAISSTERETPQYLSVDYDKLKGTFLKGPKPDEVPYPVIMEPNLVIEYYSR